MPEKEEKKVIVIPTEGEKGQRFCKMAMIALIFDIEHHAGSTIAIFMRSGSLRKILAEQGFSEEEIDEFSDMLDNLRHTVLTNNLDVVVERAFKDWDDGRV